MAQASLGCYLSVLTIAYKGRLGMVRMLCVCAHLVDILWDMLHLTP